MYLFDILNINVYTRIHPIHVAIHDSNVPNTNPKAFIFKVTITPSGKNGRNDSKNTRINPTINPPFNIKLVHVFIALCNIPKLSPSLLIIL